MKPIKRNQAPLNGDQKQAMQEYANDHGKDWRDALVADWLRCGSRWHGPFHLLMQVRNQRGPRWLFNDCLLDPKQAKGGSDV